MDQRLEIICGDTIDCMKNIGDGSVDLIVADPPYNLNKDYGNNQDKQQFDDYLNFSRQGLRNILRTIKNGFSQIIRGEAVS